MTAFSLMRVTSVAVLCALSACAVVPSRAPDNANTTAPLSSDLADRIGAAGIGDEVRSDATEALRGVSVIVARTYWSANGRECRQLVALDGAPLERIVCKQADGHWSFVRSLQANGSVNWYRSESQSATTIVPVSNLGNSAQANRADAESVVTKRRLVGKTGRVVSVERRLNEQETLPAFSERITGDANNWRAIAAANAISDINELEAGVLLSIPVDLVALGN